VKFEFFTNEEKTAEDGKVDVKSPAFSITKVQASLGALITAIAAVAPKALQASETIQVAAIASGTVIMLGVFALAAVDIVTRQRAREATLRFGSGGGGKPGKFVALPEGDLVLQQGHKSDEYEVKMVEVEGEAVTLVATRNGHSISPVFRPHTTT
jgi:hypothetical protein